MSLDEFHTAIEAAAPVKSLEEKGFQKHKKQVCEEWYIHIYINNEYIYMYVYGVSIYIYT